MNTNKIPTVIIVGRPNVGKSALFNRLAKKTRSLVYDIKGVTRDIIRDVSEWNDFKFEIIDTAGLKFDKKLDIDSIENKANEEAKHIVLSADIFLFIIDGDIGFINEDRKILLFIQKVNKSIIFIINKNDKSDTKNTFDLIQGMNFENIICISALHGRGIEDLNKKIIDIIKKNDIACNSIEEDVRVRVSFLGKPNVGKSSLLNAIINKERSIVSPIAGTTREAITEKINHDNFSFTLCDTAGVRRSRAITDRLEELMVSNTMSAIERSHIIIIVIDINLENLSDQDIKLAMDAFFKQGKGIIIVWNKTDLLKDEDFQKKRKALCILYKHFFDLVPHVYVSAKTKKGIERIIPEIERAWKRYSHRFESSEITRIVFEALTRRKLIRNEQVLKIKSASVVKTCPPTFAIKVNHPPFFESSQLSYLGKCVRKEYDLLGVPIKWIVERS